MYGPPRHPWAPPPPRPPIKRGLSGLTIALIAIGGVSVLGLGTCVVIGGLLTLSADGNSPRIDRAPVATGTAEPTATANATAPTPPTAIPLEEDEPVPTATATAGGTAEPVPTGTAASTGASTGTTTSWFCNATGFVRVCGFANVCNNQMVFGNGAGRDRFAASMMAKNACEGMARAKGGSTTCSVSCTPKSS